MLKRTVLTVMCMLLVFCSPVFAAGENAVLNDSFEEGSLFPDGWEKKMWDSNDGVSEFIWEKGGAHKGDRYVTIINHKENHARLAQVIKVKPNTYYRLSCWIKTEGLSTDKKGAGLGVENVALGSVSLWDTKGKWEYFEIYGLTAKDKNSLDLIVTLGGYGNTNVGKGSFDDISVEEVSEVPQNVQVYKFFMENNGSNTVGDPSKKIPGDIFNMLPAGEWTFLAIVVLIIYLLFAIFYLYYFKPKASVKKAKGAKKGSEQSSALIDKKYMKYLYIILGLGLLLRLILAPFYKGYHFDYGMFRYWAQAAAENLFGMYHPGKAYIDYPPVYVIVLAFCGMIFKIFHIAEGTPLFITILKLPAIIGDVLTAYIIFILAKKRLDMQKALILTALYLFNPLIWFDTVIWGQVDSVFFLTLIAIFWFILHKRYEWATVFMAISVLTKPQGIIFGPVLMFELIRLLIRDRDYKTVLRSLGAGALTTAVIILPFTAGNPNPLWLYDLLFKMTGTWKFASVNAFNFFALVGANWKEDYKTFILFTYKTWGDIFLVVTVLFTGLIYWKSRNKYTLFFGALVLDVFTFTLSSRMHERYLYPATIIVLFIYIFMKERKALDIFIATSATNFLNIFVSFIPVASSGDINSYASLCRVPPYNPILMLSSFINVCVLVYTVKLVVDVVWKNKAEAGTYEIQPAPGGTEPLQM